MKENVVDINNGRFYKADCFEILPTLPSESIDMILTDPPYFIREQTIIRRKKDKGKYRGSDIEIGWDWDEFQSEQEYLEWTKKWFLECIRILKPYRSIIIFFDRLRMNYLYQLCKENNMDIMMDIGYILKNPTPRARRIDFMRNIVSAFWAVKGEASPKKGYIFNYQLGQEKAYIEASYKNQNRFHPTEKPVNVLKTWILYLTNENDLVLDPFAGSGSTALACEETKRRWICIEKNDNYFEKAIKRLKNRIEFANLNLFSQ